MMAFDNEKVLWERLTFTPVGADGKQIIMILINFPISTNTGKPDSGLQQ